MTTASPQGAIESFRFSTRLLAPAERFARYSDFYNIGAETIALGGPVSAEIDIRRLNGLVLFERRLAGLGAERLAPRVRRNQFDHFTLQLNLSGEFHGEGAHGFRAVPPGEILLLDMAKPMRTRMPDVHLLTLAAPRAVMAAAGAEVDQLHGLIIPAERAGPLRRFLLSPLWGAEASAAGGGPDAVEILTDLLGATLGSMGLAKAPERDANADPRLHLARSFIQAHLFEETLSPARVAQAANLSRATLYRLFDECGGVRKFIQTQRLARLRLRLSNPLERQSVAALAYEAGFASEHHASRRFREAFGLPPAVFRREARLAARSAYGEEASALKQKMLAWYSHRIVGAEG